MRCPDEYGYLFRRTTAASPRWTRRATRRPGARPPPRRRRRIPAARPPARCIRDATAPRAASSSISFYHLSPLPWPRPLVACMAYALKLAGAAILLLLIGGFALILFRSGRGSASAPPSSSSSAGLLYFVWRTDKKDRAARGHRRASAHLSSGRAYRRSLSSLVVTGCGEAECRPSRRVPSCACRRRRLARSARRARVRLLQIDAPELGESECYARDALASSSARAVRASRRLERDPAARRRRPLRRLLRYVHVDDTNVNVELVRSGAATPYFRRRRARSPMRTAARRGRRCTRAGRGMWGACRVSWRPDAQVGLARGRCPSAEGHPPRDARPSARRLWTSSGRCSEADDAEL